MLRAGVLLLLACALGVPCALAQAPSAGCDGPESHQLDFWLGEWQLSYVEDGKPATSHNRITRILDGCVVLEEFEGPPGTALVGRSLSTFDRVTRRWKQTWVDNTGTYLDFTGGLQDGRMVFAREAQRDGKRFAQRMVFEDVKRDSLRWLWQRSDDGGSTWKTLWEIGYRRKP
jgi:hypothetical protein